MIRKPKPESPPTVEADEVIVVRKEDFTKLIARLVELEVTIELRESLLRQVNQMQDNHLR